MSVYPYSGAYAPPMPVCTLWLGRGGEEPTLGPVDAVIDTGADITVIPVQYLRRLGILPISLATAHSIWGDRRSVNVYAIALRLESLSLRALPVLADAEGDEVVLGRDVLNRMYVVLDGPAAMTEIVEDRTV